MDSMGTASTNQSIYTPIGASYRLENLGPNMLYAIDVQSGSYLGKGGIEHADDPHGRP